MVDLPATTSQLQTLFADGQPAFAITAADARRFIATMDVRSPYSVLAYGAKGDGSTDDSAAFQAAINACYAAGGGIVWVPPTGFYYVLNTGLFLPAGVTLKGAGSKNNDRPNAHTPASLATKGSWLNPRDASNAAIWMVVQSGPTGSGAGARVEGINFVYIQPAETGLISWVPTQFPYCIQMTDHFQSVDNVQIVGATHGIRLDGDNVVGGAFGGTGCSITNINLHVYNVGISVDFCNDVFRIEGVNVENLLGGVSVTHYMLNNLVGFDLHRCDNPWISDIQIFEAKIGFLFTDGVSQPDSQVRSLTNCCLNNIEINLCVTGFLVASTTTFVGAEISSSFFQNTPLSFVSGGFTPPTAGILLDLRSDNVAFNFTGCTFNAGNTIVSLGNGTAGTKTLLGFPHVTFSSSDFSANGDGGTSAWFVAAANAKISTSSQYYRAAGGSKKTGSGVMVEATETTL